MNLYNGDCLEVLPTFPPASVEAIITDLPYGTTACEWDSIIPLAPMWEQVKRVLKPDGVFVTTASQPFTSVLIVSNLSMFRYEWTWNKQSKGNFMQANFQPLKVHENITVFSQYPCTFVGENETAKYYPQMTAGNYRKPAKTVYPNSWRDRTKSDYVVEHKGSSQRFPQSVIEISNAINNEKEHPTQKPVTLYEYLIRTYTNAGETVLDIAMGSGTTGVAAVQTGRNFIGIEKEQKYFEIASRRIAQAPQPLFTEPPRQPTKRAPDAGKAAAQNELFG